MTPQAGMYMELTHDRAEDYALLRALRVGAVVVLQPDASKVSKIWAVVKEWGAKIILRWWDLDDGRTAQNPAGVYGELKRDPARLGALHARQWRDEVNDLRAEAVKQGLVFPSDEQIICHLVNEPDTNTLLPQVDIYTTTAVGYANSWGLTLGCYNFGTGHPAILGPDSRPDWTPLKQSLRHVKDAGHWVFLHEYYNSTGITHPDLNPWHVLRHTLSEEVLKDQQVAITEWGLEELVNHVLPGHHGYQGRITNLQFGEDLFYYLTHCAPYVAWVNIFASDLPDRVWRTFDPAAAATDLAAAVQRAQKNGGEGGETELPPGPDEPGTPDLPPERPVSPTLIKPCAGIVTQRFGESYDEYMAKYGTAGHNGLDIGNTEGTNIVSIADGEVQWVGEDVDYGKYIRIWHPKLRCHSLYAHLKHIAVRGGQRVGLREIIGLMGSTGNSTGPHLHFELRMGEQHSYRDVTWGHGKGRINPEVLYAFYGIYF